MKDNEMLLFIILIVIYYIYDKQKNKSIQENQETFVYDRVKKNYHKQPQITVIKTLIEHSKKLLEISNNKKYHDSAPAFHPSGIIKIDETVGCVSYNLALAAYAFMTGKDNRNGKPISVEKINEGFKNMKAFMWDVKTYQRYIKDKLSTEDWKAFSDAFEYIEIVITNVNSDWKFGDYDNKDMDLVVKLLSDSEEYG